MTHAFDPISLLRALTDHGVEFILIGGFAANIHGSPSVTNDLDICYERSGDNRRNLASLLKDIDARPREFPEGVPFVLDERTIRLGDSFTLETRFGNLDCLATPSGTTGYADLLPGSVQLDLGEGLTVRCASVDDLIRMKKAAGRPKDLIEVEILTALREELG